MSDPRPPAGPPRWSLLLDYLRGRQKSLPYLSMLQRRYGDTIKLPLRVPTYILSHPADIRHVLITNRLNYGKTGGLVLGKALFGNGLLTSEGGAHAANRRLIQPMFHSRRIDRLAGIMTSTCLERLSGWEEGRTVDAADEMMKMTLRVVGRALFSVDLAGHLEELGEAVILAQRYITDRIWKPIQFPRYAWKRREESYRQAIERLDRTVYEMITARRTDSSTRDDLLDLLIDGQYEDGTRMTDRQIRDEVATFIAAGHETTANALGWVWYLLALNPRVQEELLRELRQRLGGRVPVAADIPNLRYTEMVIAEAMRLFPPVWLLARRVIEEDLLPGGTTLPSGSQVVLIPYVAHRNPAYFPDPESFRPERFSERSRHDLQFVYLPFSAGPRGCIGEPFARTEAVLLLATIAQRWQLTLATGRKIEPELLQTLRPRDGIPMRLHRRS
jgi:cytochrome P450